MVERNIKTGNFEDLITLSMCKKNRTCVDIIEFLYIFFILFFYSKKKSNKVFDKIQKNNF